MTPTVFVSMFSLTSQQLDSFLVTFLLQFSPLVMALITLFFCRKNVQRSLNVSIWCQKILKNLNLHLIMPEIMDELFLAVSLMLESALNLSCVSVLLPLI